MNQNTKRADDILIVSHNFKCQSRSTSIEYFCQLLDSDFKQYNGSKVSILERLAVRLKRLSYGCSLEQWNSPCKHQKVMEEFWGIKKALRQRPEAVFFPYADFNYHYFSLAKPIIRSKRVLYSFYNTDELSNRCRTLAYFRRSEVILMTSTEVQEFLDFKFRGKGPAIMYFPPGVNTEYFRPAPKKAAGEKRVLISGSNRRDIDIMMVLMEHFGRHHPEVIFELVGIPRLKAFAAGRGNVICHDYLDEDAFVQPYLRAEIAILPLKSATSSQRLNEYIASCLPFVYTDLPGMSSELDLSRFGVGVPCGDVDGFIRETERLFFDDKRIEQYKQQCMTERKALSWASKVEVFRRALI